MIRYLPIIMLAFGLLLVSTSFASARTLDHLPVEQGQTCEVKGAKAEAGTSVPAKMTRCWKQFGLGILVPGCQFHAQLVRIDQPPVPEFSSSWPLPLDPTVNEGVAPLLDIPPPRA
ncbi:hypothetical protein [Pelagibacterium sp.]|uniref:hypothetical protein n=1 Tax=Pelagibacterium sp. TaxID=1967288 RepID=UPI003A8CDFE6